MKKMRNYASIFIVLIISLFLSACNTMTKADPNLITMYTIIEEGTGDRIGTVKVSETPHGTLFTPDLKNLPPGLSGFHVHEGGECGPGEKDGRMVPGHAAGGHYDPENTGRHEGPYGAGHLGDLPPLHVDENGRATLPVLAPRLKISDLSGRSLMIHGGGDNYSDHPEPDGGGGPRIACGVISE